jgi:hypothetical protein
MYAHTHPYAPQATIWDCGACLFTNPWAHFTLPANQPGQTEIWPNRATQHSHSRTLGPLNKLPYIQVELAR